MPGSDGGEDEGSGMSLSSKWMTEAPCGIGRAGRVGFARGAFAGTDTETLFFGTGLSSGTELDNRRLAVLVEVWFVFCLFAARSTAKSFSFSRSFSRRASYGDTIGTDLPMGPFGVPSSVFNDL